MIAIAMRLAWRVLSSRLGLIGVACGALWLWHSIDKSSAVRRAVIEYVADVELTAAREKARILRQRAEAAEAANKRLQEAIVDAEIDQRNVRQEFETYRETINPEGGPLVSPELRSVLRSDG